MRRLVTSAVLVLLLGISDASAQAINRRSSGLGSSTFTLDFNSLSSGTAPGIISGVNFGGLWTANLAFTCGGTFSTTSLYNFGCVTGQPLTNPISILFSQVVYGAAFNMITNASTSIFTAYLNGAIVGTFSGTTNLTTPEQFWYGFEGLAFDRIDLNEPLSNGAIGIDNLQVLATPEPATVGLVATGLVALAGAARLRRRRNNA